MQGRCVGGITCGGAFGYFSTDRVQPYYHTIESFDYYATADSWGGTVCVLVLVILFFGARLPSPREDLSVFLVVSRAGVGFRL